MVDITQNQYSVVISIESKASSMDTSSSRKTPKPKSFFDEFLEFSQSRIGRLRLTILGNLQYKPKNKHTQTNKQKILEYLKAKYLTLISQIDDAKPKKFTNYDINYGAGIQFRDLNHMKQVLLNLRTQLEAAQDCRAKSEIGWKDTKASFLNQTAFEFDRQKKSAICWGILLGSVICSTICRRGNQIRKIALVLAMGHLFGQTAYHCNLDHYFDTVYKIFEEDAIQFVKIDEMDRIKEEAKGEKVHNIED